MGLLHGYVLRDPATAAVQKSSYCSCTKKAMQRKLKIKNCYLLLIRQLDQPRDAKFKLRSSFKHIGLCSNSYGLLYALKEQLQLCQE